MSYRSPFFLFLIAQSFPRMLALGMCLVLLQPSVAQTPSDWTAVTTNPQVRNAADLDLDQLAQMDITVTSASKKEESLFTAPAAIFVITSDEIRRSGLDSFPELLRMVPGMTVQHVSSHSWTVSTRGFNSFPNEKMLVLIDGRAVYDLLFGGVYWDVQDLRLEDIERIEVIRGPGGALWGANAVNGVINVITKHAKHTQGPAVSTSLGHDEGYQGSARFGGQVGSRLFFRIFGKSSYWDPSVNPDGSEQPNAWHLSSAGFRSDWELSNRDRVTIEGGGYQGHVRDTALVADLTSVGNVPDVYAIQGGHILARWYRTFSPRSSLELYGYSDWSNRTDLVFAGEFRHTLEFGTQHNYQIKPRHSLIWGGSVRTTDDQTRVTIWNTFTPPDKREAFLDAFAQYELQIVPDGLKVITGTKLGHNTQTGFEIQPQIRAVWMPAKNHAIWAAVSRSIRAPTRNETDSLRFIRSNPTGPPPSPPLVFASEGNPDVESERQTAYELGYRYQYKQYFSFDAAAFYNSYYGLLHPDLTNPITTVKLDPPYTLTAWRIANTIDAQTHGLEVSGTWRPVSIWRFSASATEDRGTTAYTMSATSRHLFNLASHLDLPKGLELDSALYHVNKFRIAGFQSLIVPTTNRVDIGLTWHWRHGLSLGAWGRNLQGDWHPEGLAFLISSGQIRRSVVFKLNWDPGSEKSSPRSNP